MNKILDKILTEELESQMNRIDLSTSKKVQKVIKELFTFSTDTFLKNIGSQEAILDDDEALPQENWEWLLNTINESFHENQEEWIKGLKNQKEKIICYKYFTEQDFLEIDNIEENLKKDIKKYFTALQNFADLDNFREKFFNLPFDTLNNFTRLLLQKSPTLNKKIKISKKELKERVKKLKEDRNKIIDKISMVSRKYQSTFNIGELKDLCDNGLFYEDNLLNRAVNEYIVKLLNNKSSSEKIKDAFNTAFIVDLKYHSENCVAYAEHISLIKKEEDQEYFTPKGYQVGTRFDNAIEVTRNKDKQENFVIDKDSRLKEPNSKINQTVPPWEGGGATGVAGEEGELGSASSSRGSGGSGGGGGLSSGGGITSMEPATDFSSIEPPGPDDGGATGVGNEEGEMPTDDNGFPVDFGTPESNPEGAAKEEGGEASTKDNSEKEK